MDRAGPPFSDDSQSKAQIPKSLSSGQIGTECHQWEREEEFLLGTRTGLAEELEQKLSLLQELEGYLMPEVLF